MSTEKDYGEFKLRLNAFQEAANYYFSKAQSDKERAFVLERMEGAVGDLTSAARSMANGSCPDGWTMCPDGSCMPPGMRCK